MTGKATNPILFLHIMKTGGTSFIDIIRNNIAKDRRYPDATLEDKAEMAERMEAYLHTPRLVRVVNGSARSFDIVCGHIPYAARELLELRYDAVTLLREPVERTISYLKHCQKFHVEHKGWPLERIYDDTWYQRSFMSNYQTRIFSMTAQECLTEARLGDRQPPLPARSAFISGAPMPEAAQSLLDQGAARLALELFSPSTGIIEVNGERLERAKKNLAAVEIVGITERYQNFITSVALRFGWDVPVVPSKNVGDKQDISSDLRRRIICDTAFDRELYEFAKSIAA